MSGGYFTVEEKFISSPFALINQTENNALQKEASLFLTSVIRSNTCTSIYKFLVVFFYLMVCHCHIIQQDLL